MKAIAHIFRLGIKELLSLARDPVLLFLIAYSFTFSVYTPSKSAVMDVVNASIAIVDEDDSEAARAIREAMLPPLFLPAAQIAFRDINRDMDAGRYTFVINIPPQFQADLARDAKPTVQIVTDATAMSQAGRGPGYITQIIGQAVQPFWPGAKAANAPLVQLETRARFNPNMLQGWFVAINQVINNISVMAIFLTGAAVLREREHGNIEHLLVMPLRPFELMFAKIWANGLVVVFAALLSLFLVVQGAIGVPINFASVPLFALGLAIYLFSVTALGIMLATIVRSMPQFGLLAFPVFIVMSLLSGGQTPLESMPILLQRVMQFVPSTHFVAFSQAVLFRNASFDMVWPSLLKMLLIGSAYMVFTLSRFRKMLAAVQ